jgi:K(+)-stimulated pyrophosphate-energized sodium pump
VMNLVSVLIAPAVVSLTLGGGANTTWRIVIALVALAVIVTAVVVSKRRGTVIADTPAEAKA